MSILDIAKVRSSFPSLASGYIFAENAGGSQASRQSIDRIVDYLTNTNVQLGATYSISLDSARRAIAEGPQGAAKMFNADSSDEIVLGASSTLNLELLARALEGDVKAGDEFIITWEHEANAGCWKKLAGRIGATVKYWTPKPTREDNPYSLAYDIADLVPLISSKTRIVAFTACSNVLGSIIPVKDVVAAIRQEAKAKNARKVEVSVDCVAYAPHRSMDVKDWDVDFAVFSYYKVYGPHISAMYTRAANLRSSVSSIVHHFLSVDSIGYKLQPAGPGYEVSYGSTGAVEYLRSLSPTGSLKETFELIAVHEQTLLKPLIEFLTAPEQKARGVRIVGTEEVGLRRAPTISFVVVGEKALKSQDIVSVFDKKGGVGIRNGHFYAYSIVNELSPKVDVDDGLVRISLVHYNTVEEVEKIIDILKEALAV